MVGHGKLGEEGVGSSPVGAQPFELSLRTCRPFTLPLSDDSSDSVPSVDAKHKGLYCSLFHTRYGGQSKRRWA